MLDFNKTVELAVKSGYPDSNTGHLLYTIASTYTPDSMVEIGFNYGYSAMHLCSGSPYGHLVSIDNDSYGNVRQGMRNIRNADIKNHELWIGDSSKKEEGCISDKIQNVFSQIDLLLIDGDHSYEGCKRDWEAYKDLLSDNPIVLFHDSVRSQITKVIDEICESEEWQRFTFPVRGMKRIAGMDMLQRNTCIDNFRNL
jgi:predicted O-methyltransferase YrrM